MILMLYLFSIYILLNGTYIALNNIYIYIYIYIYISSKIYSGVKNIIFFFMPYKMPQTCVNSYISKSICCDHRVNGINFPSRFS